MRVGDASFYYRVAAGLRSNRSSLAETLDGLADGKKVRAASDDPSGAHASLVHRARLARLEGFDRSAEAARTDLSTMDQVLGEITNLLSAAQAEAMAGASGTAEDANVVRADRIETLRDQLLLLANTSQSGRYLFGGTETIDSPFDSAGTYTGNDDEVQAPIDSDSTVGSTLSGRRVFIDGGDLFAHLDDLAQALRDNRTDDVAALVPDLKTDIEHIGVVRGDVGRRMEQVDLTLDRHGDEGVRLLQRIAEIEDVDLEKIIVELQAAETATTALSAAAARMLGQSLFDFIG